MFKFMRKFPSKPLIQIGSKNNPTKHQRNYSLSAPNVRRKSASVGTAYTVAAVTLSGVATIGYAKYDNNFREWLKEQVPFTDAFIKFIFEEDLTYKESYESFQDSVIDYFKGLVDFSDPKPTPVQPQKHVVTTEHKHIQSIPIPQPIQEEKSDNKDVDISTKGVFETSKRGGSNVSIDVHNVESQLAAAAQSAVKSYNEAAKILQEYSDGVDKLVEQSFETTNSKIWNVLKFKSQRKNKSVESAEKYASDAKEHLARLKEMLKNRQISAQPEHLKEISMNLEKFEQEINLAKENFNKKLNEANNVEAYRDKILEGRKHYEEELQILCPTIDVESEHIDLSKTDLDLFILHARKNVLFLQKELVRLESYRENQLKRLMGTVDQGDDRNNLLIDEQIKAEVEKERRKIIMDYEKKNLSIHSKAEKDLRAQLKRQSEAHSDHLDDALRVKEDELKRKYDRDLNEKMLQAKLEYKTHLAAMMGRLKGMDSALKLRADADRNAYRAQALWSACQSLYSVVKTGIPGVHWTEQLRPLDKEIDAISKAASSEDELVEAVLAGIPSEALERGVYNEDALRERFLKVESVARKLALVPETGSKLPVYLMSFIQSLLLLKSAQRISKAELNDEVTDFREMTTYDILARARYWMDRGDLTQALKYMNLLTGASRSIATDWMNEARILLETQQAVNTLMAHAAACGLSYL